MASLFNTKISNTYVGLIKTIDNAVISATLRELTDGSGNQTGVYLNNAGDFKATGILEFGSLKDTGENITITKFVDEADGIANNDNDTTIPTSAAIVDYVASRITLEDLDFSGDSGTGSVDLDSQVFAVTGTSNQIVTTASGQGLSLSFASGGVVLPNNSTATTQTDGDNSTKIATTAYVDTAIEGHDTLAEVLSGGNTTGGSNISVSANDDITFTDTSKAVFGDGNDLQIYHTSNSIIYNTTGDLVLEQTVDDRDIIFKTDDGSGGTTEYFKIDGSSEKNEFFKSLFLFDNVKIQIGNAGDLEMYHDGSNSYIDETGTGNLLIRASNFQLQRADGSQVYLLANTGAEVAIYYAGSKKFETTSTGVSVTGGLTATGSSVFTGASFSDNITIADTKYAIWGDGSDFKIHHNTSDSYLQNYTGHLYIQNNSDDKDIIFQTDDGSGGVSTYLHFDGSQASGGNLYAKYPDN